MQDAASNAKMDLGKLTIQGRAFINGKYVPSKSGKTFDKLNPANGKKLTEVAHGDADDIADAVSQARRVFDKGSWSRMAPKERKIRMLKFADLMEKHADELALLETSDMGKPISISRSDDIPLSINCIRWYAEAIDKVYDEIAPTARNAVALMRREPLGVVGAVIPWNFPLLMVAWKAGPVLAAGNSLIIKPAEQSPLTAIRVAELAVQAGIPEGVLNVVPGFGETAGRAIGLHPDIDAVTFTGSTEVGKLFLQYSGQSNMKRVSLECGGKTPNVIFADAPDLDQAAAAAASGIFYNQGEVCNAGSRLLVEESIKDRVLEKIIQIGKNLKVGDPLDPQTQVGAIVDKTQHERILKYIEIGKKEGAKLRLGGNKLEHQNGWFVVPTVFDNVDNSMQIAQDEIFGPVLSTISVKDVDHAVEVANDTIYGLAAAVWTKDINKAFTVSDRIKAGVVWVNCFDHGDITSPFGGFKQSGFGRDKSLHAIDKYTDIKTVWINLT